MSDYRIDPIQGQILHEYDGIEEADNMLPNWWVASLVITIVFGMGYWIWYQSLGVGDLPIEAYNQAKLEALEKSGPVSNEVLLGLADDPNMVKAGRADFAVHCTECHAGKGEGKTGPNLTDEFWLYGGSPEQIHKTVFSGRSGKGMPDWGPKLGAGKVAQIVAYVVSIRGTNVPGKEAQGEAYDLAAEAESIAAKAATDAAAGEATATEAQVAP